MRAIFCQLVACALLKAEGEAGVDVSQVPFATLDAGGWVEALKEEPDSGVPISKLSRVECLEQLEALLAADKESNQPLTERVNFLPSDTMNEVNVLAEELGVAREAIYAANPELVFEEPLNDLKLAGKGRKPIHLPQLAPKDHLVGAQQTLQSIADQYGVALSSLVASNPHITNESMVIKGTQLNIPKDVVREQIEYGDYPIWRTVPPCSTPTTTTTSTTTHMKESSEGEYVWEIGDTIPTSFPYVHPGQPMVDPDPSVLSVVNYGDEQGHNASATHQFEMVLDASLPVSEKVEKMDGQWTGQV